jgi:hypothetical protein
MSQDCFADEIAIDFPSVELAVERMRDAFLGERPGDDVDVVVRREVLISRREAWDGLVVPIEVPIRGLCRHCGGRGGTWSEPCADCHGVGTQPEAHCVRITLPPGVTDGARIRFRVSSPGADAVRVEIRITITDAMTNRVIE